MFDFIVSYSENSFCDIIQNYNAKLSDFGLAKDGPTGDKSHVSTRVMGTYGYAAPEYLATGIILMYLLLMLVWNLWLSFLHFLFPVAFDLSTLSLTLCTGSIFLITVNQN